MHFLPKSCFLCAVQKKSHKQTFSVEGLPLVLKLGEDRIFSGKIFLTQNLISEYQFAT